MRYRPLVLLALLAAHGPLQHNMRHHPVLANWHMGSHDGSPRDFGRALAHMDRGRMAIVDHRLDRVDMGNGAKLGVGFVSGHHVGVKFKLPF